MSDSTQANLEETNKKRGFNKEGRFIKPRPHIDHLVSNQKKERRKSLQDIALRVQKLRDDEDVIRECIALRESNNGILPPDAAKAAMQRLGIKSRTTLSARIARYQDHLEAYEDEPAINGLIDIRGRPKKESLDSDQQIVAIGAYLTRRRRSVLSTGEVKTIFTRPEIDWVHSMLQLVWPDLVVSQDQVRRFLREKYKADPILFDISREDEDQVWMDRLPKRRNNVTRPKERVQSDARALPILVKFGGIYCTVTLLSIIDDYTQYVLDYQLIPRKIEDETGIVSKVDYTAEDFRLLLANVMDTFEFRPLFVYTDRAKQFEAIVPFLKLLADENLEPPTRWLPGRRRYAPGKGKMEKYQDLVDDLLRNLPAYIGDWDRDRPKKLSKEEIKEIMSFEDLKTEFDERTRRWNELPRDGKPSRREIFFSKPGPAIKPPSRFRISLLGILEKEYKRCRVYPRGILYDNVYYQPKYNTPEDYELLANNMDQEVPIGGALLGENRHVVLACLDRINWIEVIPDDQQEIANSTYNKLQRRLQQRKRSGRQERRQKFEEIVRERTGKLPGIEAQTGAATLIDPVGQKVSDEPVADNTQDDLGISGEDSTPGEVQSANSGQVPATETPPPQRNQVEPLTDIPNFAEILRQMHKDAPS